MTRSRLRLCAIVDRSSVTVPSEMSTTARRCTLIRASSEVGVHRHQGTAAGDVPQPVVSSSSSAAPDVDRDRSATRNDASDRRWRLVATHNQPTSTSPSSHEKTRLLAYRAAAVQYLNKNAAATVGSGSAVHHYVLPSCGSGGGGGGSAIVGSNMVFPAMSTMSLSMLGYASPTTPPPSPPLAMPPPRRLQVIATGSGGATTAVTSLFSLPPPAKPQQQRQRLYQQHQLSVRSENVMMTSSTANGSRNLRRLSASETRLPGASSATVATALPATSTRSVSSRLQGSNYGSLGGLLDVGR